MLSTLGDYYNRSRPRPRDIKLVMDTNRPGLTQTFLPALRATMDSVRTPLTTLSSLVSDHPYLALAAGASVTSLAVWYTSGGMDQSGRPRRRPQGPPDTLMVYGLGTKPGIPSLSPFVLKLEVFLKLTKVPYVLCEKNISSTKDKIPWISYNGEEIADSHFCIEFVKKQFGVDLDRGLSAEQKAVARAFRIMMDEFHFWLNAYFRMHDTEDPGLVRFIKTQRARQMFYDRYVNYLQGQGVGRHSTAEVLGLYTDNLKAVQVFLGNKKFMMGETPTEVDCSVFPFLAGLVFYPPREFVKHAGEDYLQKKFPKLYEYSLRMKELTYPDFN